MGVLGRIASWFKSTPPPQHAHGGLKPYRGPDLDATGQRFSDHSTNRLNAHLWENAHGASINALLIGNLYGIQARAAYSYETNPLFEGVVNTFANDVVGRDGPAVKVHADGDDERSEKLIEQAWAEVWNAPEPRQNQSGAQVAKTWIRGLMNAGSYLNIWADVDRPGGLSNFGWQSVHARRLATPHQHAGTQNVALGIRVSSRNGRPVEYYVDRWSGVAGAELRGMEFRRYRASQVNHVFEAREPEQITGYPWMTTAIDDAAHLKDYDAYVREAAKNSAALTPFYEASAPELVSGVSAATAACLPIEPGQANIVTPGYKASSLTPTQPGAQYKEYYNTQAAKIGRPVHMPLMVVLLSVGDANFSSAQFEGSVYGDSVSAGQGLLERRTLRPAMQLLIADLAMRRQIPPGQRYKIEFSWPVPPNANFERYVRAVIMLVEAGVISLPMATALFGHDFDDVVESRKRAERDLMQAGLPSATASRVNANADQPGEDNVNGDNENPANRLRSMLGV